jgi:hypothetical protein
MIQVIDMTRNWPSSAGRTARTGAGAWAPARPVPGFLLVNWLETVMDLVGLWVQDSVFIPQAYQAPITR